jgi:hypothetical protein
VGEYCLHLNQRATFIIIYLLAEIGLQKLIFVAIVIQQFFLIVMRVREVRDGLLWFDGKFCACHAGLGLSMLSYVDALPFYHVSGFMRNAYSARSGHKIVIKVVTYL